MSVSQVTPFPVIHRVSGKIYEREPLYLNIQKAASSAVVADPAVEAFHRSLPYYQSTPLTSLPVVAQELGVGHVFVKDESLRFDLPSFKILGASWAVYRAVCDRVGVPASVSLEVAAIAAQERRVRLVTCSAGNWGRAVARMGKYLGIETSVYMSRNIDEATRERIQGEGAKVEVVDGNYDDSIAAAIAEAKLTGALLVMDTSWEDFKQIPQVNYFFRCPSP